jgi:SAM-dependent methyltransferase
MKIRDSGMPDERMWSTFFDPSTILHRLRIPRTGIIVDMGCGYGTFTVPAAMMTNGQVIGFDIDKDMLGICKCKAENLNLHNLTVVHKDFLSQGTGLKETSVDYVMLFNILHSAYPLQLLGEAYRILRSDGIAAVIHWNYDPNTPRGPDMSIRPKPEQCVQWLQQAGFTVPHPVIDLPPYHYGIIGVRY